jgi:hypothetical protein
MQDVTLSRLTLRSLLDMTNPSRNNNAEVVRGNAYFSRCLLFCRYFFDDKFSFIKEFVLIDAATFPTVNDPFSMIKYILKKKKMGPVFLY